MRARVRLNKQMHRPTPLTQLPKMVSTAPKIYMNFPTHFRHSPGISPGFGTMRYCAERRAREASTSRHGRLMRLGTARRTRTVPLARPSTPVTHKAPPSLRNRPKRPIRPTGRLRTDRSGAGKRASMHLGSAERNGWYSPRQAHHRVSHAGLRRRSYVAKEAGRYTR